MRLFCKTIDQSVLCILKTPFARLLDTEDPELCRALSRLVDLLTPTMAAEEEPLARRKQELLLNNVNCVGSNSVNDIEQTILRIGILHGVRRF